MEDEAAMVDHLDTGRSTIWRWRITFARCILSRDGMMQDIIVGENKHVDFVPSVWVLVV